MDIIKNNNLIEFIIQFYSLNNVYQLNWNAVNYNVINSINMLFLGQAK